MLQEYVTRERLSYPLYAPSPTERGETEVLTKLNQRFVEIGVPISIKLGTKTFKNVVGVNKVFGTPKADLVLVSWDGKMLAPCAYLSHKMGSSAKDFQQYSGITPKADGKRPGSISKHAAVQSFLKAIAQPGIMRKIVQMKQRVWRAVTDPTLIGKSVYGPEYGSGARNEDNIDCIAQGTPELVYDTRAKLGTLTFSAGVHMHGETRPFLENPYRAVLGARYTAGRNFQVNGKNYTDVRVLILPLVVLGLNHDSI